MCTLLMTDMVMKLSRRNITLETDGVSVSTRLQTHSRQGRDV